VKKIILLVCILLVPSVLLASGDFSLWGGVAFPAELGKVNNLLNAHYFDSPGQISQIIYGITTGLDGAYWYYSWWGIGGRAAYTMLPSGSTTGMTGTELLTWTFDGSMFQFLIGVPFLFEFFDGIISLGGGVYAGVGFAFMKSVEFNNTTGFNLIDIRDYGSGAVFEIPMRITYHISSSFLLDVNFSWKSANFNFYPRPNRIFQNADFSGIMAGLGFNWRFSSKDWPWYNKKFSFSE
jgi:hypothetical protein